MEKEETKDVQHSARGIYLLNERVKLEEADKSCWYDERSCVFLAKAA